MLHGFIEQTDWPDVKHDYEPSGAETTERL